MQNQSGSWYIYVQQGRKTTPEQSTTPEGRGGGRGSRLSEVEPVAVRVVEVAIGAAVWVAKAVEVVEVRWSELPPRPRLVFLAPGLEGALGESGSQGRRFYRVKAPVAGSASRGGCGFRGRCFPRRGKRKRLVLSLGPSPSIPMLRWLPHST
jgi:hypothetical protein